jgi:hypothetical protein
LADVWNIICSKAEIFGALAGSSSHGVLVRLTVPATSIVLIRKRINPVRPATFGAGITLACSFLWDFLKRRPMAAFEKGDQMFITVLVTVCLDLAVQGTCLTVPVVNSSQDQVSMIGCMGLEGMESAKEFWERHPLYHSWQFKGWACQIGNSAPPDKRNT